MRHQIEEFHQQLDYTTPEQINKKKKKKKKKRPGNR